jgi:DC-STAMP domain-containing protein 1
MYFVSLIALGYLQAYLSRLRRIICAFFYPKREKKRILFLYNDRLKKRKRYHSFKIGFLKKLIKDKEQLINENLFHFFAYLWAKITNSKKCIICEQSVQHNYTVCAQENCQLVYCSQCWQLSGRICHACDQRQCEDTDLTDDQV